jgi:hypothetical protein
MLSLVVADLYFYHIRQNAIVHAGTWYEPPQTAQYIQAQDAGLYRVYSFGAVTEFLETYREAGGWEGDLQPYVAQREFLQPDLNILYDVPAADGYLNLTPAYLTQVWGNEKVPGFVEQLFYKSGDRLMAWQGLGKLLSLYNVRYLITNMPFEDGGFELLGIYGPEAYLYENVNALPRAIMVPDYILAADATAALEAMVAPGFDPERQVVLLTGEDRELPPRNVLTDPAGIGAHAEVTRYEPLHVVVETGSNHPGFLVVSDLYYPGWEATVDEEPTPIYEANACVRAVPVDQGAHTVEFRFKPKPLLYGAAISLASALLLLVVWRKV